jgi:hypothetical protein
MNNNPFHKPQPAADSPIRRLYKKLAKGIRNLFEPEEVEVTFKNEGKYRTYTYTKIESKRVA